MGFFLDAAGDDRIFNMLSEAEDVYLFLGSLISSSSCELPIFLFLTHPVFAFLKNLRMDLLAIEKIDGDNCKSCNSIPII